MHGVDQSARDVHRSVLHDRLADRGAVFGEVAGWERPNWFATGDMEREYRYSYGKQNWYPASAVECEATRRRVALYDQSSFAKFMVTGPGAMAVLNHIGSADVDTPVGKVSYTQWLNDRGGIEADLTVTRTADREYMVVTGAAVANRDYHTLRRALRGRDAELADITMELPTIGVMGPRSIKTEILIESVGASGISIRDASRMLGIKPANLPMLQKSLGR